MFVDLNLPELCHFSTDTLENWLFSTYSRYNNVPFHNFKHAFMVTQMVSIVNLSNYIIIIIMSNLKFTKSLVSIGFERLCQWSIVLRIRIPIYIQIYTYQLLAFVCMVYFSLEMNDSEVIYVYMVVVDFSLSIHSNQILSSIESNKYMK